MAIHPGCNRIFFRTSVLTFVYQVFTVGVHRSPYDLELICQPCYPILKPKQQLFPARFGHITHIKKTMQIRNPRTVHQVSVQSFESSQVFLKARHPLAPAFTGLANRRSTESSGELAPPVKVKKRGTPSATPPDPCCSCGMWLVAFFGKKSDHEVSWKVQHHLWNIFDNFTWITTCPPNPMWAT